MRIKKVLSLAVVLAMVLTVVPMFGLTASAAVDAPESAALTGSLLEAMVAAAGEPALDITKAVISQGNEVSPNDAQIGDWGIDELSSANASDKLNVAINKNGGGNNSNGLNGINSLMFWNSSAEHGGTVKVPTEVTEKTKNKDFMVFEFRKGSNIDTSNNVNCDAVTFYNENGYDGTDGNTKKKNTILKFTYNQSGISPSTDKNQGENAPLDNYIAAANGTYVRVFIAKTSDDKYDVIWQTKANEGDEYVTAVTVPGMDSGYAKDGFGYIRVWAGALNYKNFAFGALKIYAGNYTDISKVTIKYQGPESVDLGSKEIYGANGSTINITDELAPEIINSDGKVYVKAEEGNSDTHEVQGSGDNTVTVKYDADSITAVKAPEQVDTRIGVYPDNLPETVEATLNSGGTYNAKVTWDEGQINTAIAQKTESPASIHGTVEGYEEGTTLSLNVKDKDDYLVAYYSFDTDTKNEAPEKIGKYDGTKGSGTSIVDTDKIKGNGAAYFDGSSHEASRIVLDTAKGELLGDEIITKTGELTISTFVKFEENTQNNRRIFDFGSQTDGQELFFTPDGGNWSGDFKLQGKGSARPYWNTLVADQWKHVAVTIKNKNDGTWEAKVYYNGNIPAGVNGSSPGGEAVATFTGDFREVAGKSGTYYLGDSHWTDDGQFKGWMDDFKVYGVALTQDEIKDVAGIREVTVTLKEGETDASTYKTEAFDGLEVTVPAGVYAPQAYLDAAETVEIKNGTATVTTAKKQLDMFTWDGREGNGNNSVAFVGAFNSYNKANIMAWDGEFDKRIAYAYVDVPSKKDGERYAIKFVGDYVNANGDSKTHQSPVVTISTVSKDDLASVDLTKGAESATALNGLNWAAIATGVNFSKYSKIEGEVSDGDYNGSNRPTGTVIVPVEGLGQGEQALRFKLTSQGGFAVKDLKVVAIPQDVKVSSSLGYNKDFTVDFSVGDLPDGATVGIYREAEGQSGDDTKVGEDITKENLTGKDNVINVSGSSNAIYKAVVTTVVDGVDFILGSAEGAVYDLLVKDITANYADKAYKDMDPDMVQAANKIIAKGGLLSEATLVNGADSIMEFDTQNTKKVVIKEDYTKLGIGFIVESGEIYIGADAKTVTEGTDGGSYAYLEITENGVTLSGKIENGEVKTNEAITLSLDSVNIEFVETLIEELEANGADAEADFIPEL